MSTRSLTQRTRRADHGEQEGSGRSRRVQALQGRRQEGREAVLPVRDLPRHDHVARRRCRDHRPRRDLEVHRRRWRTGCPRAAVRGGGRSGDDELHPAAGLVLLLPLLSPAHLQVARDGRSRHRRDPDAAPDPPDHAAVLRSPPGALDPAPPRRVRRRDPRCHLDGRADVEGRDGQGGARLGGGRASVPEWAKQQGFADNPVAVDGATLFAESGCLNCHVYLGAGGQNLGAPDSAEEGAKGRGIEWQVAHLKNPSSKIAGLADAGVRRPRRREPSQDCDLPRGVERHRRSRATRAPSARRRAVPARVRARSSDLSPVCPCATHGPDVYALS